MASQQAFESLDLIPSFPEEIARECLMRVSSKLHPNLQAVCRRWKALVDSSDFQEERRRAGHTDHFVCLIQALPQAHPCLGKYPVYGVTVYDSKLHSWERLPPIPEYPDGLPLFSKCVSVGENLLVLGGWKPSTWEAVQSVYIFSFSTGKWRRGSDMLGVRSFFGCGVLGDLVLVAGGHDDSKNALDTAEVYNLELDQWQALPTMSQERDECKGAVIDGKFFVISGYTTESQGQFCRSADIFDPCSGSWSVAEEIWPMATCPSAIVSLDGQLFALQRHELLRYNFNANLWTMIDTIPQPLRVAPCATVLRGSLFISGSSRTGGIGLYSSYMYQIRNHTEAPAGKWAKVESGEEFSGLVQAACTVEN